MEWAFGDLGIFLSISDGTLKSACIVYFEVVLEVSCESDLAVSEVVAL